MKREKREILYKGTIAIVEHAKGVKSVEIGRIHGNEEVFNMEVYGPMLCALMRDKRGKCLGLILTDKRIALGKSKTRKAKR